MAEDTAELKIRLTSRKIETKLDAFVFGAAEFGGKIFGACFAIAVVYGILFALGVVPVEPK